MEYSRLRPFLPNNAGPDEGCFVSHMMVRSYGESHTHRLCRIPCADTLTNP
jgi:hypothetical protein